MEIRELKITELDDLLDLYTHLHDVDDPLPDRNVVEVIWHDIQENSHFKYFGAFAIGS